MNTHTLESISKMASTMIDTSDQKPDRWWDVPPTLFFIGTNRDSGKWVLMESEPHSKLMQAFDHPVEFLMTMTELIKGSDDPMPMPWDGAPVQFDGLMLRNEGWGLTATSPEGQKKMQEWVEAGNRIVDHPDAIEVRSMIVHIPGMEGSPIEAFQQRGKEVGIHSGENIGGRVPEALVELADALKVMFPDG